MWEEDNYYGEKGLSGPGAEEIKAIGSWTVSSERARQEGVSSRWLRA